MSGIFNPNDNVIFDIYSDSYSESKRMSFINDVADIYDINGHMQDMTQFIQGLRESNNPMGKSVRYKIILRSTSGVDKHVKEGRLVRVTQFKDKYHRGWEKLSDVRDYWIAKINNMDSAGRYIMLSLIDRGSDGPRS